MGYLSSLTIGGTDYAVSDGGLYGTCSTAAGTAAKVVTCANFDGLETGVTIRVKFTYSNTAANATMNVNSTGAKNLCRYGTTRVGTTTRASWQAGAVVAFTYDGTSWVQNDYLEDTGVTTDTKNTAGATNTNNQLYLVGATTQSASTQTYTKSDVYVDGGSFIHAPSFQAHDDLGNVGTFNNLKITPSSESADGYIKVLLEMVSPISGVSNSILKWDGVYALGDACEKAVDTSIASGSTSTNLPTSAAVAAYVNSAIGDMSGALVYKGTASTASAISGTSYKKGWYWIAADTFALTSSINVEPGDMIIAKQDKTSTFANDIDVVQTNIDTLTTTEIDNLWAAA